MDSKNFSAFEIDAIGEILNISLGASATAVSTMLNARVDITTPVVKVLSKEEFEISNLEPAVGVEITYIAGLSGSNIMLLKRHDVKVIVDMLMGMETPEEEFELNELNISAICEVMNQMMGASATALSEFLGKVVNISTPSSFEIGDVNDFKEKYYDNDEYMVVVGFTLKIADQLESEFINVMTPDLAKELVRGFLPQEMLEPIPEPVQIPKPAQIPEPVPIPEPVIETKTELREPASGGILSQEEIEKLLSGSFGGDEPINAEPPADKETAGGSQEIPQMTGDNQMAVQQMMDQIQTQQQMMSQMQQMISQLQSEQQNMRKTGSPEPKTINVRPIPQNSLKDGDIRFEEQEENRELIMGVPLEVSVEIGRTRKLVKEILEFTKGSLVILDKLAGEQVDLYVNGRCIAKGDVVVVDDNFGIRITEITKKNGE
ncbi:flagellar motor switch protein FliN [Lacrimispora celerecrescens]|uniref:Flagellar motor switch protein FliN/FliY n=1 Tax=[Clostridium] celerecrescens 18A TaxID=1286362 RepID=A0A2M8ZCH3_9FIRM|nr:flagellar motor switch protein FliN [Lacrimispora celerecrescens]PJJ31162.1 flagellar motor switch protein FliN/FliY [[Clostridium] celerecrescens 18A]